MNIIRASTAITLLMFTMTSLPAQTFEISSQSGYVYFPPGLGPGIPGCLANNYRCDFGITGSVTVAADATSLTFTAANFQLAGNQAIQDDPPALAAVTGSAAADLLVNDVGTLPLESDTAGVRVYEMQLGFTPLTVTIDGGQLRVQGGRDNTPVDGDGYTFDLATTEVPEPSVTCLLSLGLVSALMLRTRRR
ncbi:MAG: PEP-CTERM sorting domain-containing protein [Bythopirellula sp.]